MPLHAIVSKLPSYWIGIPSIEFSGGDSIRLLIENTSLHSVEENRASTQIRQPSYFIARSINHRNILQSKTRWLSGFGGDVRGWTFSLTEGRFLWRRWFVHGTESEGGDDCVMETCLQLRNQRLHSWNVVCNIPSRRGFPIYWSKTRSLSSRRGWTVNASSCDCKQAPIILNRHSLHRILRRRFDKATYRKHVVALRWRKLSFMQAC